MKRAILFAVFAVAAQSASALPDLARGKAALDRGDHATAEANLKPLAERGYVEAQIELARLYARSNEPARWREAESLLRQAMQVEPTVVIALARVLLLDPANADPAEVRDLLDTAAAQGNADALKLQVRLYRSYPGLFHTEEAAVHALKLAQSPLADERDEAMAWFRAFADEPRYGAKLVELCREDLAQQPECLADLARHHRAQGEDEALAQIVERTRQGQQDGGLGNDDVIAVVRVLASEDLPGAPRNREAYELMSAIAQPDADTRERMAKLLINDPSLDPDRDAEVLLREAMAAGSLDAQMVLGRRLMRDSHPDADPARAEKLLLEASTRVPAAHYFLGRFYERGYDGRMQPARALAHYLEAARKGYARADLALAQMYWRNRGVRVDPVNAFAFARLARHHQFEEAEPLLAEIAAVMEPAQRAQADRLAEREFDARRGNVRALAANETSPQDTP